MPLSPRRRRLLMMLIGSAVACSPSASVSETATSVGIASEPTTTLAPTTALSPTTVATTDTTTPRPQWLGQSTLGTDRDGFGLSEPTPQRLQGRSFATEDTLAGPPVDAELVVNDAEGFVATRSVPSDGIITRSTWTEGCPIQRNELAYLTVTFLGFDGETHTGELLVHVDVADDIVAVFGEIFRQRYPIEEMRIVTQADLDAAPTGDTNNTSAFVCRTVKGTSVFSQHAYGLAVDINPFHNPYVSDRSGTLRVLPELASYYIDRSRQEEALLDADHAVVRAFEAIGWHWGGNWSSIKDYQHFSRNGR